MRTTLDLPDDILRRAKIAAVERGSSSRHRMTRPPITLSADAPLRQLSPDAVKSLDAESVAEADAVRTRAAHR